MPAKRGRLPVVADGATLAECEMILRDRNRGMTVAEVCKKWDISEPTLTARVRRAIDSVNVQDIEEWRAKENAAIDDMSAHWYEQLKIAAELAQASAMRTRTVNGVEVPNPSFEYLDRSARLREGALLGLLRVRERRAKLLGLDRAVAQEVTVTVQDETDRAVKELNERMAKVMQIASAPADAKLDDIVDAEVVGEGDAVMAPARSET